MEREVIVDPGELMDPSTRRGTAECLLGDTHTVIYQRKSKAFILSSIYVLPCFGDRVEI